MTSRQKAHAAKMRERRGTRPWDYRHREDAKRFVLRLRFMFDQGYTDEFIADALDLDPVFVGMLRTSKRQRLNEF
jgi:hypothetical protein